MLFVVTSPFAKAPVMKKKKGEKEGINVTGKHAQFQPGDLVVAVFYFTGLLASRGLLIAAIVPSELSSPTNCNICSLACSLV